MRRRSSFIHVAEIQERLDVPPRRLHSRWKERVVAIGVQRLLEVRVTRIFRARLRLVDAEVGRREGTLHEVDDCGMDAESGKRTAAVERELAAEPVLLGPERGTRGGHLRVSTAEVCGAASGRPIALRVGVELLRRGKRVPE